MQPMPKKDYGCFLKTSSYAVESSLVSIALENILLTFTP